MNKTVALVLAMILSCSTVSIYAQYTRADTLQGSVTPQRAWWDLTHYHLDITVDPDKRFLWGSNTVSYTVLDTGRVMQIDLQAPLRLMAAKQDGQSLDIITEGDAHFIQLQKPQIVGAQEQIYLTYEGSPKVARRPPWDGGITWQTDSNGKPFVATSCQGVGASIWWPCKNHMYDEVDSLDMTVRVPLGLMNVSNGRLVAVDTIDERWLQTHWKVNNPINHYGVNINIGDYVHFGEVYQGLKGPLSMDYYVLREHEEAARAHFAQAPMTMEAFEYWFGPYPFYEDGYKLVEAPYLGMEHQSSVTYGNQYSNGYKGTDLSGTGWGLTFDFIIVHETGHEWFANNVTYADAADMWIHESFTSYSESLFLEYHQDKKAASEYVIGTRRMIQNDIPIIGEYGVNKRGSGDMYFKGANMLHTLRQIVDHDSLWHGMLIALNDTFYHQTVSTVEVEAFMSDYLDRDVTAIFDQYLRDVRVPILEYTIEEDSILRYRYTNVIPNFTMPVELWINNEKVRLEPHDTWRSLAHDSPIEKVIVDGDYYVALMRF